MALYDDLQGLLNRGRGDYGTEDQVNRLIGEAQNRASSEGRTITGYRPFSYQYGGGRGGVRTESFDVPVFGMTEEERLAPLRAEQQRLAGIQQKQFESQQADIAEQLKILKGEKSAVAQMQQQYSDALAKEAEAKQKAQEQAMQDMQTARANAAMANRSGVLQIRPAGSTPSTAGTQGFKRRAQQFGTAYKGLSKIKSGMVNA